MKSILTITAIIIVLIVITLCSGQDLKNKLGDFGPANFFQSTEDTNKKEVKKSEAKPKESDSIPVNEDVKQDISPYLNKVKISNVEIGNSSRPSLITLRTDLKQDEKINLTGWQIETKNGTFDVPKGMEKFRTFYTKEPKDDIIVKRDDIIYLYNSSNPIGEGKNFRSNKCFGYLERYDYFDFPISKRCPKPEESEIYHLSPCCKSFILKLGRCEFPDYSDNSNIYQDRECTDYLSKNLNYSGCFNNYHQDEDFLENKWHIYLEEEIIVENDWDTLYLRDENGLLIDKDSYGRPSCEE